MATAPSAGSHATGSAPAAAAWPARRDVPASTAAHASSTACSGVLSPDTAAPMASWSCAEMSGYADAAGRALPWTTISENFWCHGLSRKKGTSRNTLFRTGRWPVAVVMRPTFPGDSTNCRNSAAARCRAGIAGEHHPHPAAGAGRARPRRLLRDRGHVPLRELGRRQARLQVAELPVPAQEHRRVPRHRGRGQLLVIAVAQHRQRRGAALDRPAQEREHVDHPLPVRLLAEHRPPGAVHQLAALGPEHREVVEDRGLPAPRVVEIAADPLLPGHAARRRRSARPRWPAAAARGPSGSTGAGSPSRARCRRRGPARRTACRW